MARIAALALIPGLAAPFGQCLADAFPDDHGDSVVEGATPVTLNATTAGSVEIYVDRDHFSFTAEQGFQYRIEVTPGGLDDAEVKLRAADGSFGVLVGTNSVGQTGVDFWYPHVTATTVLYVDVGGFAAFTLGSYTTRISSTPIVDTEPDGLPDLWEDLYFMNLTKLPGGDEDGDGFTNVQELLLGTDPTDAGSGLVFTALQPLAAPNQDVTWKSAVLRQYQLSAGPSLDGISWTPLTTVPAGGPTTSFTDPNSGSPSNRYYRVQMVE